MNELFKDVMAWQKALDNARTPKDIASAFQQVVHSLLPEAHVALYFDTEALTNASPLAQRVAESRIPESADHYRQLAVPLLAETGVLGVVEIMLAQPPSRAEIAALLAYCHTTSVNLEHLSWRANPRIFQQLVENSNVAIDVADLNGSLIYANPAAARLYGYSSPDDMLGYNVSELYYGETEQLIADQLVSQANTPAGWIGEVTHTNSQGAPIPIKIAVFGMRDMQQNMTSFGAIVQDMSEYQRLLNSLRQQAWRLEALNHLGTLLSSSLDRNTILKVATEQIVSLLSVDHCSIAVIDETGTAADIVAEYPPSPVAGGKIRLIGNPVYEMHLISEFFISLDVANDTRLDNVRDSLSMLDIQSMLVIRLEVKGKLIGSIGLDSVGRLREFTYEDIETCRTLAYQIGLAIENADLYAQAVGANKLKSQFLATMSHELRTPLNAILGYTEMVVGGSYGPLTDRMRDRLQRVYRNGQNLLEMINDVLDLSKIEAGEMRLTPQTVELTPVVMSAIASIGPQAESKRLHLGVEISANMHPVLGDAGRLRQMILNLLSNAIKFTRDGSIIVTLKHVHVSDGETHSSKPNSGGLVTFSTQANELPPGDWVTVAVTDTGIGIAPENFKFIFDAFRQVDGSTVREYGGSGLGLAITRQLAELQGGRLWVESKLGQGSTFTLALPATRRHDPNLVQSQRPEIVSPSDSIKS